MLMHQASKLARGTTLQKKDITQHDFDAKLKAIQLDAHLLVIEH